MGPGAAHLFQVFTEAAREEGTCLEAPAARAADALLHPCFLQVFKGCIGGKASELKQDDGEPVCPVDLVVLRWVVGASARLQDPL